MKSKQDIILNFDIENIFNETLQNVKNKIQDISIKPNTIHLLLQYVMEYVEETPLKGEEQKKMCLRIFRSLIMELTDGDKEEVLLQLLNDGTISNLIELIVDASKGKLNINTAVATSIGCANSCFTYFFRKLKIKNLKIEN